MKRKTYSSPSRCEHNIAGKPHVFWNLGLGAITLNFATREHWETPLKVLIHFRSKKQKILRGHLHCPALPAGHLQNCNIPDPSLKKNSWCWCAFEKPERCHVQSYNPFHSAASIAQTIKLCTELRHSGQMSFQNKSRIANALQILLFYFFRRKDLRQILDLKTVTHPFCYIDCLKIRGFLSVEKSASPKAEGTFWDNRPFVNIF